MVYYKLTNQNMQTYNGFQWELGKWEAAIPGPNLDLCSSSWLHCYDSPLLAVLHNPIHASIRNPRLFEIEVAGDTKDDRGIKRGFRKMRLVKEVPLPTVTREQRIRYGILCAKSVCDSPSFIKWTDSWLSGEDRSEAAAEAAAKAAWAAEANKPLNLIELAEQAIN